MNLTPFSPSQDPDGDSTAFVLDMRFPGQRADAASGLNYNYFRDYDPSSGRYAKADPIGLQGGLAMFSYVLGNPLGYSDRFGLQTGQTTVDAHCVRWGANGACVEAMGGARAQVGPESSWHRSGNHLVLFRWMCAKRGRRRSGRAGAGTSSRRSCSSCTGRV